MVRDATTPAPSSCTVIPVEKKVVFIPQMGAGGGVGVVLGVAGMDNRKYQGGGVRPVLSPARRPPAVRAGGEFGAAK